jgi:hypothetical protein
MVIPAGDGGPPGESGSVRDVQSRDTILVKADGSVVDAATITAVDGVYGITFAFTLPKTDWRAEIIQVSASNYASYIQTIGGHDHVIAAYYAPDTNAAGGSQAEVSIPFAMLNTPQAFARIDAAYATLTQIEAIA